jgi:hypothetical protein
VTNPLILIVKLTYALSMFAEKSPISLTTIWSTKAKRHSRSWVR